MNSIKQIKFWSNIFFLVPLVFAIAYNVFWYAIIQGLVFIISSYFHFHHEKRIEYIDVTSSTSLMLANFILLFKGHWILPYSITAIVFAITAIFFYSRQFKHGYNFNHGLWHIFSAGVSFFCVATFLHFTNLF